MEREEFFDLFKPHELYRNLYLHNPKAFEQPVKNWEEFCRHYRSFESGEKIDIPMQPPTVMASLFLETDYFLEGIWGEVAIVANAQYCPAFLHKLEFIKLIYVFRGNCQFYTDGKWVRLSAGNACIVAPDVEQTVFSCADEDVVLNLLMRRSAFLESFWELLETGDGGMITDFFWRMLYHKPGGSFLFLKSEPDHLLEESVMELYEEANLAPIKSGLVMKSMMMTIFAYFIRRDVTGIGEPGERKRYPLPQYLLYMQSHICSITLPVLAKEFYVSEGYLSRYIRRETGVTFSHLLKDMRMKRAGELLVNTECGIEKIVSLVGYTDQSIFFRNFKVMYGMTPQTFRKKNRWDRYMYLEEHL